MLRGVAAPGVEMAEILPDLTELGVALRAFLLGGMVVKEGLGDRFTVRGYGVGSDRRIQPRQFAEDGLSTTST